MYSSTAARYVIIDSKEMEVKDPDDRYLQLFQRSSILPEGQLGSCHIFFLRTVLFSGYVSVANLGVYSG